MHAADYARIEKAIHYIEKNFRRQPNLEEVAQSVGLSDYHFHRLFTRWAGISPKRFVQFLTAEYARGLLMESQSALGAAYEAGLSGPGRLHDLIVNVYAVTPGELKVEGAGLTIRYGVHPSPFGACLLATTDKGICDLSFLPGLRAGEAEAELRKRWRRAKLVDGSEDHESRRGPDLRPTAAERSFPAERDRQGDQFPGQGVGGHLAHSAGVCGVVRGHRNPDRCSRGGPRRRHRLGAKSRGVPYPLPPGHPQDGRLRELRRGPSPQEGDPRLGSGEIQGQVFTINHHLKGH